MPSIAMGGLLAPLKPALRARVKTQARWRMARHGDAALAIIREELEIPGLTAHRRRLLAAVAEAIQAHEIARPWPVETMD